MLRTKVRAVFLMRCELPNLHHVGVSPAPWPAERRRALIPRDDVLEVGVNGAPRGADVAAEPPQVV
eukprot:COSAG04_NODE_22170_length_360_cov_0.597701_2_plen_65_part_01